MGSCDPTLDCGEAQHDGGSDDGNAADHDFGDNSPACTAQLAEQKPPPEYADQSIRIPEWERYGKTNIADREHCQRIRDRPERAREKRPDDEVLFLHEVGHDVASALEKSRKRPPCGKNPGDHAQGNGKRGQTRIDELGRCLGCPKPYTCAESAKDPQTVQGSKLRRRWGLGSSPHVCDVDGAS
jgi:hypothetical protein